jgi:predicted O-linked N-acetylglucosamine transferase (SPINDLY family)
VTPFQGARNEIFALKPAPIQISYMGFPGTTGADYIDYLVTDELVSPLKFSHIYSEKLVHLPHCYFVNDYKQKNTDVLDPNSQLKRSDYGLPEDKFLFACFNQLYKMDPEIFTMWYFGTSNTAAKWLFCAFLSCLFFRMDFCLELSSFLHYIFVIAVLP